MFQGGGMRKDCASVDQPSASCWGSSVPAARKWGSRGGRSHCSCCCVQQGAEAPWLVCERTTQKRAWHSRKRRVPKNSQNTGSLRAERAVDATKCFPLLPWVWSHTISFSQSCVVAPGSPRSSLTRRPPSYYHRLTVPADRRPLVGPESCASYVCKGQLRPLLDVYIRDTVAEALQMCPLTQSHQPKKDMNFGPVRTSSVTSWIKARWLFLFKHSFSNIFTKKLRHFEKSIWDFTLLG